MTGYVLNFGSPALRQWLLSRIHVSQLPVSLAFMLCQSRAHLVSEHTHELLAGLNLTKSLVVIFVSFSC